MKKYTLSILILITFIGLFIPVFFATAQEEAKGTCTNMRDGGVPMHNVTKTLCTSYPYEGTWEQTSTPAGATSPQGTCSNLANGGLPFSTTKEDCEDPNGSYRGIWTPPRTTSPAEPLEPEQNNSNPTDTTYSPLAPIPGLDKTIDTTEDCAFGKYLNVMIKLIIGLVAVIAMVMIVMGGVEYMTSELISSKEAGKDRIKNALLGLLIAIAAYTILNTINPKLLDACLENLPKATIIISLDEANFAKTERPASSVGTAYKLSGVTSPGVSDFVNNVLSKGTPLKNIVVDSSLGRAYFYAGTSSVNVQIRIGREGTSAAGQGVAGDLKTPKGISTITSLRIPGNGQSVISGNGFNMGPAFINIGAKYNNADRGIGFHGRYEAGLGGLTNGCIRMSNDDLLALAPYMKAGVQVFIQ